LADLAKITVPVDARLVASAIYFGRAHSCAVSFLGVERQLPLVIKMPNDVNCGDLKRDLLWDPLRKDPLFDKLPAGAGAKGLKSWKVTPHPVRSMVGYLHRSLRT
jgi:hypothetical protein